MAFTPRHLINGVPGDLIPVSDRGFRYGDGCFETMAVRNGGIRLWDRHYRRLSDACRRLGIRTGVNREQLERELAGLTAGVDRAVVRLTVTRGADEAGYRPEPGLVGNRVASLLPDRVYPTTHRTNGIKVHLCEARISRNPRLAGIKHLNRLEQVMARAEWGEEFVEGLLCDDRGQVIEGTITNVFIASQHRVSTPRLDECGVAGVMRAEVIDRLRALGISCREEPVSVEQLLAADECFLTNAVIGIWPVTGINDTRFAIGDVCSRLATDMAALLE
jgi:4-amino-4-deoxychorismate lyase